MANEIKVTQKYLDYAGLQRFWTKAKQYILQVQSAVVAGRAGQDVTGLNPNFEWKPTDNAWITVNASTDSLGKTTYTINDGNIQTKMGLIEQKLKTVEETSGVTSVTVTDNAGNLVKVSADKTQGDINITVDDSELENFATSTTANIKKVDDVRKSEMSALYGSAYTPSDELGGAGTVNGLTYGTITAINQQLVALGNSNVSKLTVTDTNAEGVNYVDFKSSSETGTGEIVLTVDETALDTAIKTINDNSLAETTSRKNADALLAGAGWDKENGAWIADQTPVYNNIAQLSEKLKAAETSISALSSATNFIGAFETQEEALAKIQELGDIFIVGNKEYIYNAEVTQDNPVSWDNVVELGDTTEELNRIKALEAWVNAPISNDEIDSLFPELSGE